MLAALVRKEVLGSRPTRARPSVASTASSRTCSSASPTRRSRGRAQGTAPRRRRAPRQARRRRAGDRRGDRRALPRLPTGRTGRRRRAEIKARAQESSPGPVSERPRSAANEEAQHYFEQAAELADDPLAEARLRERAGAPAWAAGRSTRRRRTSSSRSSSTRRQGRRTRPRGSRRGSARPNGGRAASTRRSSGWSGPSRCSPATSRTRIRDARRRARAPSLLQGRDRSGASGSTPRSRSPSRCGCRGALPGPEHAGAASPATRGTPSRPSR